MKIALDPYMFRTTPLDELPGLVADLGYEHIELSPREDFIPFFGHPRVDRDGVARFKAALAGAGVQVSSLLPLWRWSGPDEDERQAAVRYWKRGIEIAVELGVRVMKSELNGRPEQASRSAAMFWKSMEELPLASMRLVGRPLGRSVARPGSHNRSDDFARSSEPSTGARRSSPGARGSTPSAATLSTAGRLARPDHATDPRLRTARLRQVGRRGGLNRRPGHPGGLGQPRRRLRRPGTACARGAVGAR